MLIACSSRPRSTLLLFRPIYIVLGCGWNASRSCSPAIAGRQDPPKAFALLGPEARNEMDWNHKGKNRPQKEPQQYLQFQTFLVNPEFENPIVAYSI